VRRSFATIGAGLVPLVLATLAASAAADARPDRTGSPSAVASPLAAAPRSPIAHGPLETAVVDVPPFLSPEAPLNFRRVRTAGASHVRLILYWRLVVPAPNAQQRPAGFDPASPADPAYDWHQIDRQITLARAAGLEPIVGIQYAPRWAERGTEGNVGTRNPDPSELQLFARAAALRYSGRFAGLPRVKYWQVWNEPNLNLFLHPQSPALYRAMVNAFAAGILYARPDNTIIAGGTSPFAFPNIAMAPLRFMRELLCVSSGPRPRPTCRTRLRFDIWSHHPYTSGGPTQRARRKGDASLGDLPQMRRMLEAAVRAGHIVSRGRVRFWVTEFSWDSSPPDPRAVPARLHARWVAEALYRMWQARVSLVTWFQLRDDPLTASEFQSGLYLNSGRGYASDRPKLALRAFRFPFVAFRGHRGISVWGRTPGGRPDVVVVERAVGSGWKGLVALRTNGDGIFRGVIPSRANGPLRARLFDWDDASVPFSLVRPPNRTLWPFGCGGVLSCD
jgi:hypothetical protein